MSQQQQPVDEVQPGSILAGKYRVERVLGQGGMGRVVEARHVALDDRVAMKFLLPEFAQHPEASARFLREARAAVRIKSEHVAKVTDVGTLESGAPYMVMEFLEGNDLSQQLERSGVLAVHDAVDFVIQAAEALAEAHSYGIVHRDIKPANMFLGKGLDGAPLVKVLDFGISKYNDGNSDNLTRTMAAMGSALYMSPEQMQQSKTVDHRTDIYALGITLYELLAGKQPFYAETLPQLCAEVLTGTPTPLRSVRNDLPPGLSDVLERAYARDRDQRYQTIAQLVLGLAPFAPPRSRNTIERIARMAGLDPNSAPAPAPQRISVPPEQPIVVGGYSGPVSEKAAAAFAGQGGLATGQTNMDLARTDPKAGAKPSGSKGATIMLFAAMLLAGAAVAGYFVFVRPGQLSAAAGTAAPASEPAKTEPAKAPAETTSEPKPATTGAPSAAPTSEPSAAASAEPAASATPSAAASAEPSASPVAQVGSPTKGPTKKPAATAAPAVTAAPAKTAAPPTTAAPTPTKPGIMEM